MPPLSAVERFFERLVERPMARLFGMPVQPVQVLRRIERAMEGGARSRGGRVLAPDRFTVRVHPADLARLRDADGVAEDLASGALAFARRQGLALADRPRVGIRADETVERGGIEVEASVSDLPDAPAEAATATRAYPVARPAVARLSLGIREPDQAPRTVEIGDRAVVIGRASSADLRLADHEVSREHARIQARDGHLVLMDLGSTNGTWVGGQRVREVVLGVGDRIEIGRTALVVLGDLGGPVGSTAPAGPDGR